MLPANHRGGHRQRHEERPEHCQLYARETQHDTISACSPRTTEAGIVSDTKNDRNTVSCMHVKHTTTQLVHAIHTQSRTSSVTDNRGSQPFLSERNTAFSVIRYKQQTIHVNVLRTTELSTGLSTVGSRAISIFGPSTWNDLSLALRKK